MSDKRINLRLNNDEYQKIKLNADTLGIPPSTYVKLRMDYDRLIQPKFTIQESKYINYQLFKIGNNLNQVAKVLNINKNQLTDNPLLMNSLLKKMNQIDKGIDYLWQSFK